MEDQKTLEVFRSAPVPQAVLKNAIPAMAVSLLMLIYNLADTFFIGQTHNDILVAAITMATQVFLLFMTAGTVFGIGGTSVISRALGKGRTEYAKKVCSFCMWCCVGVGIVLAILFLAFMDQILMLLGASADTWEPAKIYLTILAFSGPFTMIANAFCNIIRAEGQAMKAMTGQVIGNLLNIILDPILIVGFNWGIAGAAIATVIGNVVSACYYMIYFVRGKSVLSIRPRDFMAKDQVCSSVLAIGIPASLGSLLLTVAHILVNRQMTGYGDLAVAAVGVAMRVTMISAMLCIGFGQGIQPVLGYCVGAKMWDRFKKVMRTSLLYSFILSAALTGICYLFTGQIVQAFLTEPAAIGYSMTFTRILLSTSFFFGMFYVFTNSIQAMGAASAALVINISRQGIIYIPLLFLFQALFGMNGLVWAQPMADTLSMALVIILYFREQRTRQP